MGFSSLVLIDYASITSSRYMSCSFLHGIRPFGFITSSSSSFTNISVKVGCPMTFICLPVSTHHVAVPSISLLYFFPTLGSPLPNGNLFIIFSFGILHLLLSVYISYTTVSLIYHIFTQCYCFQILLNFITIFYAICSKHFNFSLNNYIISN